MIAVRSMRTIEADPQGGFDLLFWMGAAFDYKTPFRQALADMVVLLDKSVPTSLDLPAHEDWEDFIEGTLTFGGDVLRVYYEHSLGYLTLSSDSRGLLEKVGALERFPRGWNQAGDSPEIEFVIQAGHWTRGPACMARPLSLDLRERIVGAVEAGQSRRQAADQFAVSESAAIKLLQRWERTGSVAPGQMGGQKQHALSAHEAVVRALVAAEPDLTLEELKARLAEQGIVVARSSVDRFLKAIKLTRKKRRSTPPSRNAPTSPRRARPGASSRAR